MNAKVLYVRNVCFQTNRFRWNQFGTPPPPLLLEILAKPLIKEVEWRSRRGKFIYNRTYNSVGLNKVSHLSRRDRAPSRLPIKKLKSLLQKTRKVRLFVWIRRVWKNTPLSSEIHCYVKNRKGLHLNRYRSNCNSVRFLLKGQLQNQFVNEGRCICRLSIKAQAIQVE